MSEQKKEVEYVSKEEIGAFVAERTADRRDRAERNKRILDIRQRPRIDAEGREVLDPTPVEVPFGHERPQTLQEQIAALLVKPPVPNDELFEEDDEFLVLSPYEQVYDPVLGVEVSAAEFMENQEGYKKAYERSTEALTHSDLQQMFSGVEPSGESPSPSTGGSQAGGETSGDPLPDRDWETSTPSTGS